MRPEHAVVGAGAVFCLLVLTAALVPDEVWDEEVPRTARLMAGASAAGGGAPGPAIAGPRGYPQAPGQATAQTAAMPGLVPFTRAKTERFQGTVTDTVSRGADLGWGQVHIWIDIGKGQTREISLAPGWYLQHLGCTFRTNSWAQGVGFVFDRKRPNAELYAKTVTVNGSTCRLRNDEGFALWSNRLK